MAEQLSDPVLHPVTVRDRVGSLSSGEPIDGRTLFAQVNECFRRGLDVAHQLDRLLA